MEGEIVKRTRRERGREHERKKDLRERGKKDEIE